MWFKHPVKYHSHTMLSAFAIDCLMDCLPFFLLLLFLHQVPQFNTQWNEKRKKVVFRLLGIYRWTIENLFISFLFFFTPLFPYIYIYKFWPPFHSVVNKNVFSPVTRETHSHVIYTMHPTKYEIQIVSNPIWNINMVLFLIFSSFICQRLHTPPVYATICPFGNGWRLFLSWSSERKTTSLVAFDFIDLFSTVHVVFSFNFPMHSIAFYYVCRCCCWRFFLNKNNIERFFLSSAWQMTTKLKSRLTKSHSVIMLWLCLQIEGCTYAFFF